MGYDPSEPRDKSGKWAGGAARGHNAGGGNRELALAIAKGTLKGAAEGVILSAAIGAVTGGIGGGLAPVLIARGIASGVMAGMRESTVHVVLGGGMGAVNSMSEHREKMKAAIELQHKGNIDRAVTRRKKD